MGKGRWIGFVLAWAAGLGVGWVLFVPSNPPASRAPSSSRAGAIDGTSNGRTPSDGIAGDEFRPRKQADDSGRSNSSDSSSSDVPARAVPEAGDAAPATLVLDARGGTGRCHVVIGMWSIEGERVSHVERVRVGEAREIELAAGSYPVAWTRDDGTRFETSVKLGAAERVELDLANPAPDREVRMRPGCGTLDVILDAPVSATTAGVRLELRGHGPLHRDEVRRRTGPRGLGRFIVRPGRYVLEIGPFLRDVEVVGGEHTTLRIPHEDRGAVLLRPEQRGPHTLRDASGALVPAALASGPEGRAFLYVPAGRYTLHRLAGVTEVAVGPVVVRAGESVAVDGETPRGGVLIWIARPGDAAPPTRTHAEHRQWQFPQPIVRLQSADGARVFEAPMPTQSKHNCPEEMRLHAMVWVTRIDGVRAGSYELLVSAPGFETDRRVVSVGDLVERYETLLRWVGD